jgi:hypothetical protein
MACRVYRPLRCCSGIGLCSGVCACGIVSVHVCIPPAQRSSGDNVRLGLVVREHEQMVQALLSITSAPAGHEQLHRCVSSL